VIGPEAALELLQALAAVGLAALGLGLLGAERLGVFSLGGSRAVFLEAESRGIPESVDF
jgi:hypothetical protein